MMSRMEQMLTQQNQPKAPEPASPKGSGILRTPPQLNEFSKSINKDSRSNEPESRMVNHKNGNLPRTYFPWFDGKDPIDWAIRCKLFFDVYMVPEIVKPRMAILHFSGDALDWYKGNLVNLDSTTWDQLIAAVNKQFSEEQEDYVIDALNKIQQIGKVEDYIRKFKQLRSRVKHINPYFPEAYYVSSL